VRLYVDGSEVGTGSTATHPIGYGLPGVDGVLGAFGGSCVSPLNYAGDLDEPRVWGRALSAVEIAASAAMGDAATMRLDRPAPCELRPRRRPAARLAHCRQELHPHDVRPEPDPGAGVGREQGQAV